MSLIVYKYSAFVHKVLYNTYTVPIKDAFHIISKIKIGKIVTDVNVICLFFILSRYSNRILFQCPDMFCTDTRYYCNYKNRLLLWNGYCLGHTL